MTRLHRFSCPAPLSLALSGGALAPAPSSDVLSSPALPEPPGNRAHDFGWQ
ncbi:hypothetical protein OHR86_10535 [Streptomyces sp. NBC_00441]|uniref:hypothetical protein n=1 Tax=Streptomyces sp. NBC_00441 TaxID=2975742 RepID=UPI002E2E1330|nr:hypothetical protein [Streptomyces sp. NBC_00441]